MTSSVSLVVLSALGLLFVAQLSEACFASGVCGGYGCPTAVASCGGGCGGGYSCGAYGCFKARAASSKTLVASGEEAPRAQNPDQKFMSCCRDRNLPDACLRHCSFATYTRDALQAMYFRSDKCPLQAAAELQFCAAQGRDHRECCARNGVASTLSGQKCLTFCDQRPGNVTQLDMTYMSCFDRFESMKGCFWNDLTQGSGAGPARRFDNL
ncbi:hypothetical protein QR680_010368 [Steinernema hermaphroditum]|uniref:Domain of unknown function DB domain-containing protein n=1 Tax=Steinernema hermaphroditum TaxID=289476 RepID=A0AA39INQ8_9BILA|nr:hypothetical protein QR680_010368 [Steinernema hermaphroditum]